MRTLFGPWVFLLAGCVPGDYDPYRSYSYDPGYRSYWHYNHRDRDRHREHRNAPPAPTYTQKPTPPPSPVGRTLGDVLRGSR